jgi:hypothetical protein
MPLSKLVFKPGANRDQTNYASEGSWFDMDKVRFRSGFPEKIGGWVVQNFQQYIGVARSVFTWGTTDGSELIGIGTDVKMYVSAGTYMYDITPLRTTLVSPATNNCIGTTNTSRDVTITVSGHGLTTGDYVTISGVTGPTVGGIPNTEINAEHVVTVIDSNYIYYYCCNSRHKYHNRPRWYGYYYCMSNYNGLFRGNFWIRLGYKYLESRLMGF